MKTKPRFLVKKAAVLGSGVMGSQIAAHLANANVDVVLFDLAAKEGDPNGVVKKSLAFLQKLDPTPFSVKSKSSKITPANYNENLSLLKECDLVIEAIAERMDFKQQLYQNISEHMSSNCVFATNTSGLSIRDLAKNLPEHLAQNFLGVHFFNPPRYMQLVELIPHEKTNAAAVDHLEEFLTTVLGKSVVRAHDTPNFIANRIGVFSMLATMHYTAKYNLSFDVVDALTGPALGRPKSATWRTLDVVGLDTFSHVTKTMRDNLTEDPWKELFHLPSWMDAMISKGATGQKAGAGIYKKVGKEIHVLDLQTQSYVASKPEVDASVAEILKIKNPAEKLEKLRQSQSAQAQFLWSITRDLFHYCAVQLESIADNARDLDLAIRWGYGWKMGPFELWQASGWQSVATALAEDIASGKALTSTPLPAWVTESNRTGVHSNAGSFSPSQKTMEPRRELPVYTRQLFPQTVFGEKATYGKTIFENEGVRLWTTDDEVSILSFKSKMHAIGSEVLDGVIASVKIAEENYKGMVIWQTEPPFSAGANLVQVSQAAAENRFDILEDMIKKFQVASMALKYSMVPTVAAASGLVLGGGCEFMMHCTKTVAALETYIGLVEMGVGLLPAGGGCKEFALRAANDAKGGAIFPFLSKYFETIAMARVSKSAQEAKEIGYLRESDTIVFHPEELLYVAISEAKNLYDTGFRPALKSTDIPVVGKGGVATLKAFLVNMREGAFISDHDFEIGKRVATILGGGEIDQNCTVSEDWLLDLELRYFMELLKTKKTQERIAYMLKTGKPLRN